MSELNYRYKVDSTTRATLDAASNPNPAVYYWLDGSDYYTSQRHLEYINSLGLYTVDVATIVSTLKGDSENQDILSVQETQFLNSIAQVKFTEIENDVSTTADEEIDETVELMRINFTPSEFGNKALIDFTASATSSSNSDRVIVFHLFIGETGSEVFKRATKVFSDKKDFRSGSCSLMYSYDLPNTNQHTAIIKWGLNGSGSARIYASSDAEYEHASLRVMEVRA